MAEEVAATASPLMSAQEEASDDEEPSQLSIWEGYGRYPFTISSFYKFSPVQKRFQYKVRPVRWGCYRSCKLSQRWLVTNNALAPGTIFPQYADCYYTIKPDALFDCMIPKLQPPISAYLWHWTTVWEITKEQFSLVNVLLLITGFHSLSPKRPEASIETFVRVPTGQLSLPLRWDPSVDIRVTWKGKILTFPSESHHKSLFLLNAHSDCATNVP